MSDEDGVDVVVVVEEEDGPFAANNGVNFHDVDADVGLPSLPLACINIGCRECIDTDTTFLLVFHILLFPQTSLLMPKSNDSFLSCCRCRPLPRLLVN